MADSAAEISLIAKPKGYTEKPHGMHLHAANNTSIVTYGITRRTVDFGLRRPFNWTFWKADVTYSIFVAAALAHFHLVADLKRKLLVDNSTSLQVEVNLGTSTVTRISLVDPSHPFAHIISKFPRVLENNLPHRIKRCFSLHRNNKSSPGRKEGQSLQKF